MYVQEWDMKAVHLSAKVDKWQLPMRKRGKWTGLPEGVSGNHNHMPIDSSFYYYFFLATFLHIFGWKLALWCFFAKYVMVWGGWQHIVQIYNPILFWCPFPIRQYHILKHYLNYYARMRGGKRIRIPRFLLTFSHRFALLWAYLQFGETLT